MNAIPPAADLKKEFLAFLDAAARAHAGELFVRLEGDRALVMATIRGEQVQVAEWPAARCEPFLTAAFAACDKADAYEYGAARSMRMSGVETPLPEGVSMVLVQFFAPKDGGRHLVCRLTYAGDVCCGSCGGA